jgi:hypothetical protein
MYCGIFKEYEVKLYHDNGSFECIKTEQWHDTFWIWLEETLQDRKFEGRLTIHDGSELQELHAEIINGERELIIS